MPTFASHCSFFENSCCFSRGQQRTVHICILCLVCRTLRRQRPRTLLILALWSRATFKKIQKIAGLIQAWLVRWRPGQLGAAEKNVESDSPTCCKCIDRVVARLTSACCFSALVTTQLTRARCTRWQGDMVDSHDWHGFSASGTELETIIYAFMWYKHVTSTFRVYGQQNT